MSSTELPLLSGCIGVHEWQQLGEFLQEIFHELLRRFTHKYSGFFWNFMEMA